MAWVRIDDGFDEHPKIAGLDPRAVAVFVFGLCYCNRNLTDGFIPQSYGRRVSARGVRILEACGLWDPVEGGWMVHDYTDYQPSKASVLKERQRNAERQQRYRDAGSNGVTNTVSNGGPVPNPVPVPKPNQEKAPSGSLRSPSPPGGRQRRVTIVTGEFREQLVREYAEAYGSRTHVAEEIAAALSHKARLKYTDEQAYLRNWLRRGVPRDRRVALVADAGPRFVQRVVNGKREWVEESSA